MKVTLIIFFILILNFRLFGQTKKSWDYIDESGNGLSIDNFTDLPNILDSTFFKQNISVEDFLGEDSNASVQITKIDKKNKSKYFIKILVIPKEPDIVQLLKLPYHWYFLLKVKCKKEVGIIKKAIVYQGVEI